MNALFTTVLALLLTCSAFGQELTISKAKVEETLNSLQKRQKLCEAQLGSVEDMVLIKDDLKTGVDAGELSQKAMDQIVLMMETMIETMENVCTSVDEMALMATIEMESKSETSADFLTTKEEEMKVKAKNGFLKIQTQVDLEGFFQGEKELVNIFKVQVEGLILAIDNL